MIKFLDLKAINERYKKELNLAFNAFLDGGNYILGNQVETFEVSFANYCGSKFCIGVSSGLDALHLIIEAYKILEVLEDGDEIIVPANTYIATLLAVSHKNLKPVLVEPRLHTFNIDPVEVEKAITSKTKAILGVHLYGQLYDIMALENICKKYNLLLLEDAAQAHGAKFIDGRKAGNVSDAGAFSFYPTKNLGALGEAGAITTDDEELAEIIRKLRNYGRKSSYNNIYKGFNCRLDEIQAAFLNIKLKFLDEDNKKRREVATSYFNELKNNVITLPYCENLNSHVFHLFVIRSKQRSKLKEYLLNKGIETYIHYPTPPNIQTAYRKLNKMNLPITKQIHDEVLSIPVNQLLKPDEVNHIIDSLSNF